MKANVMTATITGVPRARARGGGKHRQRKSTVVSTVSLHIYSDKG